MYACVSETYAQSPVSLQTTDSAPYAAAPTELPLEEQAVAAKREARLRQFAARQSAAMTSAQTQCFHSTLRQKSADLTTVPAPETATPQPRSATVRDACVSVPPAMREPTSVNERLIKAADDGNAKVLAQMLFHDPLLARTRLNRQGETALWRAATRNHAEAVTVLLDQLANPLLRVADEELLSAVIRAGAVDVLRLLIDRSVVVSAHEAARHCENVSDPAIVAMLRADYTLEPQQFNWSLHEAAARKGKTHTVKILTEAGA
jgi:hypothetical protein